MTYDPEGDEPIGDGDRTTARDVAVTEGPTKVEGENAFTVRFTLATSTALRWTPARS